MRSLWKNLIQSLLTAQQYLTLGAIAIMVIGVIFFKVDIGFFGFLVGTVLILLKAAR